MKKLLSITLVLIAFSAKPQGTIFLYLDTVYACTPDTVVVPVYVDNFNSVSSISFKLIYQNVGCKCIGATNYYPVINGGFNVFNVVEDTLPGIDTIGFAWFSTMPGTIPDSGVLLELLFEPPQVNTALIWDVTGAGGTVTCQNGMIVPGLDSIIQQPADLTVMNGDSAIFTIIVNNMVISKYQWQESTDGGISWNNINNNYPYFGANTNTLIINPVSILAVNNNKYRCNISQCANLVSNSATLSVLLPISLMGNLTYRNTQNSPLSNTLIQLKQSGIILYSTATNTSGFYIFSDVPTGVFDIEIDCTKPWGGGNALDALMVLQHFVGMITLTGLPYQVADVNADGIISSIDAMLILRRFVGSISSFQVSDWQYDQPSVTIPVTGTTTLDINALCTGDVSGSYVP